MDFNAIKRTPEHQTKTRERILAIVDEKHGAYWVDLLDGMPTVEPVMVQLALRSLLKDGTLRQREDEQEHDWEYVRRRSPNPEKCETQKP